MNKANTDLTFFTNEENHTLLDRFKTTLKDTRLFDVLVGYFRSRGFYLLYSAIEPIEKTRILVAVKGNIDPAIKADIERYRTLVLNPFSHYDTEIHEIKTELQSAIAAVENLKNNIALLIEA